MHATTCQLTFSSQKPKQDRECPSVATSSWPMSYSQSVRAACRKTGRCISNYLHWQLSARPKTLIWLHTSYPLQLKCYIFVSLSEATTALMPLTCSIVSNCGVIEHSGPMLPVLVSLAVARLEAAPDEDTLVDLLVANRETMGNRL